MNLSQYLLAISFLCYAVPAKATITIHISGYTASPFANAPGNGDELAVDDDGLLYAPHSGGITRFAANAESNTWSAAVGYSLAIADDGNSFLATRNSGSSILRIDTGGSFSTLVPSSSNLAWSWLAAGPSNILVASIWAGTGQGVYSIDTVTGNYSSIVSGGPGSGGAGYYRDMEFGLDGKLYSLGYDGTENGLFRLEAGLFTRVAVLPHGGAGLTVDSSGVFYTATTYLGAGEVWRIDTSANQTQLLASGFNIPSGIAFDAQTERLFVRDQSAPFQITEITVPEPSMSLLLVCGTLILFRRPLVSFRRSPEANGGSTVRGGRL